MTYGNRPEYQLAEKMKNRFSGRGAAVSGMQASTTSELVRKAQMGGDPSENCSELDFRGARQQRSAQNPGVRPGYGTSVSAGTMGQKTPSAGPRPAQPQKTAAGTSRPAQAAGSGAEKKTKPSAGQPSGKTRTAPAAKPKNASASSGRPGNPKNGRPKTNANTAAQRKKAAKKKDAGRVRPVSVQAAGEITEVRVDGRRMTPMFAVFLVIGTMMIMSIVLSFSEIYQTTSEIARLEADLAALRDQAAELELELEEKNDIRLIEQIATEELGMVKEDAVQREYISLSDGERIDILDDGSAENETAPGILLSSIWSSLGSLFDYFR